MSRSLFLQCLLLVSFPAYVGAVFILLFNLVDEKQVIHWGVTLTVAYFPIILTVFLVASEITGNCLYLYVRPHPRDTPMELTTRADYPKTFYSMQVILFLIACLMYYVTLKVYRMDIF